MDSNKDIFLQKVKLVHGDRYDYSLVEYKGCKVKIKIICREHGVFEQTPDSHIQNKNCSKCTKNYSPTTEEYIKKALKVHKGKYSYSKTVYFKNTVKIIITCPIHGDFEQLANNHVNNGYGCEKCGKIIRGNSKSNFHRSRKQDFSHIIPPEGARIISLTRGKYALVDDEDYERVNQYNWNCYKDKGGRFYAVAMIKGKYIRLHRFILKLKYDETNIYIDHKDGDGLNNRRFNIRKCTPQQNACNQRVQNRIKSSKYKGVSWNKGVKKWHSYIKQFGKRVNLGLYDVEEDAARAYDEKAKELFKEFAYLNFTQ